MKDSAGLVTDRHLSYSHDGEENMKYYVKICLIIISAVLFVSCYICTNEIIKSEELDDINKIVLFSRDAGATTSPSLQVSIIKKDKPLENSKGNVCITNGRSLDYTIEENCITIFYSGELFLKKDSFENYFIKYEMR